MEKLKNENMDTSYEILMKYERSVAEDSKGEQSIWKIQKSNLDSIDDIKFFYDK